MFLRAIKAAVKLGLYENKEVRYNHPTRPAPYYNVSSFLSLLD